MSLLKNIQLTFGDNAMSSKVLTSSQIEKIVKTIQRSDITTVYNGYITCDTAISASNAFMLESNGIIYTGSIIPDEYTISASKTTIAEGDEIIFESTGVAVESLSFKVKDITLNSLKQIDGIGEVKAIKILASIELGKRVYLDNNLVNIKMDTPEKIYNYMKSEVEGKNQEYFYAIYLDSKKNLIDKKLLFIGTLNKSIVHPREIFKYAYLLSASSIICVHNHPSGNVIPSDEDIYITNTLVNIGKMQGIIIQDHIIIGDNNYFSFYENDMLGDRKHEKVIKW